MAQKIIKENKYINRELSWIQFNQRVLDLSIDPKTPLLEKIKFSSIFSNNLDEFFMVRVASLKSQVDGGITKKSDDGKTAKEQLISIRKHLTPLIKKQQQTVHKYLKEEFKKENIYILDYIELTDRQKIWVNNYFETAIFPILTPLAVDPAHPFPFISNLSLNLAAIIIDPETEQEQFARIKLPTEIIDRFITIPNQSNIKEISTDHIAIPIEQVVAYNLEMLFPGMIIRKYSFFRVTRDADLELRDLEADDLMSALEEGLRKRRKGGEVVRLEVSENTPNSILNLLKEGMNIEEDYLYEIKGFLALDQLIELTKIDAPDLKFIQHNGTTHPSLKNSQLKANDISEANKKIFQNIFSIIRRKDILVHHPYNLFSTSIEELINQASEDKSVMAIKMTLYRISKDSSIITALIKAAENGKQVMALVELKARFDEDNNIQWAKQLEESGVHVVYGVIGLKTHTKVTLIVRKEKNRMRTYFHIGTGNYNAKTSKLYTDLGLLSCQPELGQDLIELFNFLSGFSKQQGYRKLLVAPMTLRKGLESLINREIGNAKKGIPAKIQAKMNSLVDQKIINLLYEASNAGVKIELIVRGMCCLYPMKKGLSENIKVVSVIGQFLEHSRIFWFANNGKPEIFIGSADWMRRNLDRRIEAVTPIENIELKNEIEGLLQHYLNGSSDSWYMQEDGTYIKEEKEGLTSIQNELIQFYEKYNN